jgi:hypothetical protein
VKEITRRVCDNCCYRKGKRCNLWEVRIKEPDDSHCECWRDTRFYTNTGYLKKDS